MGKRLLHIIATPRGLASHTGRISAALLEELHSKYEDLDVQTLDLFSVDLPAIAGVNIKTKYALMTGQPIDEAARGSWRDIERTIEEFLAAEMYLLTVPMWNFGVPYALKYYIDAIVQPGYLFRYDEDGRPEPLVHGKKMVCVTSRGADYTGPLAPLDFLESYLRAIFTFVGITDLTFFNAQPMDVTPELRRGAFSSSIHDVRTWATQTDVGIIDRQLGGAVARRSEAAGHRRVARRRGWSGAVSRDALQKGCRAAVRLSLVGLGC